MASVTESWRRLKARAGGSSEEEEDSAFDIAHVLRALKLKNVSTLRDVAAQDLKKEPLDDKTYLMERVISLTSELPTGSAASHTLTHTFLQQLWTDLQHPPKSYLGDKYCYRTADGSNNNFLWPHVGAAGQPYARSIRAVSRQPIARPDPGVIFDSVLKRREFKPHPNKISSVLFYVASVIIHDIFHTSHSDFNISETSSYLDLAPLYGSNAETQASIRTFKDGKLKLDCFADSRILGFPPGVGLLLIMFNRFHNNVANTLAQIDEDDRFSRILHPPGRARPEDAEKKYDEALFQTARLVTTGLYINIILKDYVRTILNLNRVDSDWNLDPRSSEGKALFGEKIAEATGNQVSAEFNLVYRWHSCVSERDAQWTQATVDKIFPHRKENPSASDFLRALSDWGRSLPADPHARPFASLDRDENGRFADDDLAEIWTASVEDVAGAFGARHVPEILKGVEVLGIIQARSWNLASLNEFRKYFKLKPWATFEEINPDPEIVEQLRRLYEHPDNVELYPGVIVEAAKETKLPGSGLCANFTTSRAILSDAVALVRGDRFYTVDYTTSHLTNFGYDAAHYDLSINHGCVIYKLVLNALPNNYARNSIYAHYPLVIPSENEHIMQSLGLTDVYDFAHPQHLPIPAAVRSYIGCKSVYAMAARSNSLPEAVLSIVPVLEEESHGAIMDGLRKYLATTPNETYVRQFFEKTTSKLLKQNVYKLAQVKQVDLIRDVANIAQVHFAACLFALPLKTEDNLEGTYDGSDLWALLTAIYSSIHPRQNAADSFKAQHTVRPVVQELGRILETNVKSVDPKNHGLISNLLELLHDQTSDDLTDQSTHLIQNMLQTGISSQQLVYHYIIPVAATIVVEQARAFADCIDYFLGTGIEHLVEIRRLATSDSVEANGQIERYVVEALRITTNLKAYAQLDSSLIVEQDDKKQEYPSGSWVQCDLYAANHDTQNFDDPDKFDLSRKESSYLPGLPGSAPHFPGSDLGRPAIVGLLKAICCLEGLRRAPGPIGQMKRAAGRDGSDLYLTTDESAAHTYPSSMKVNFE